MTLDVHTEQTKSLNFIKNSCEQPQNRKGSNDGIYLEKMQGESA